MEIIELLEVQLYALDHEACNLAAVAHINDYTISQEWDRFWEWYNSLFLVSKIWEKAKKIIDEINIKKYGKLRCELCEFKIEKSCHHHHEVYNIRRLCSIPYVCHEECHRLYHSCNKLQSKHYKWYYLIIKTGKELIDYLASKILKVEIVNLDQLKY